MSTATEATTVRWQSQRAGSHALREPSYGFAELVIPDQAWQGSFIQSSAVSASGLTWELAILSAFASESESVAPFRILSVGASQYVSPGPERYEIARRAIDLLDQWLADDSGYDEETWPELKEALDRDRLSGRRLF